MSDPGQSYDEQQQRLPPSFDERHDDITQGGHPSYPDSFQDSGYQYQNTENQQSYIHSANQAQPVQERTETGAYTPSYPSVAASGSGGYNASQQQQYLQSHPQAQWNYNQQSQPQHWLYPVPVLPIPYPATTAPTYPPYSLTQAQLPAFSPTSFAYPHQFGNTLSQAPPTPASWQDYNSYSQYQSHPIAGQSGSQSPTAGTSYASSYHQAAPYQPQQPQRQQQSPQAAFFSPRYTQYQPSSTGLSRRPSTSGAALTPEQIQALTPVQRQALHTIQQRRTSGSSPSTNTLPSNQTSLNTYVADLSYYEKPTCSAEQFEREWQASLQKEDNELAQKAARGQIPYHQAIRMATAALPAFSDVEELCNGLTTSGYRVTVERLKQIIRGINTGYVTHLKLSGTKAALIASISGYLRELAASRSAEYFRVAKLVGEAQGYHYGNNGSAAAGTSTVASSSNAAIAPRASTSSLSPYPGHANGTNGYGMANTAGGASSTSGTQFLSKPSDFNLDRHSSASGTNGYGAARYNTPNYQPAATSSSSNITTYPAYNRLAPSPAPARGAGYPASMHQSAQGQASTSSSSGTNPNIPTSWPAKLPPKPSGLAGQPAVPMNFKASPFYKIVAAVSTVATLNKAHPGDRNTASCIVQLTEDQRQKLSAARTSSSNTQYQLRLYCTSVDHYSPNTGYGFNPNSRNGLPIEFPSACEAKLNDCAVSANLKGIKKKPGTTPPACVSAAKYPSGHHKSGQYALKLDNLNEYNKVDLNYANTDRNFYMIVYFVEYTSVPQFVNRIKENKVRSKEEVIKSLQRQAEDPDIQATSETISLKDPLSFMDMQTPVRGLHCMHIQCFDANIFLSMMETTPTWLCPFCNRPINPDDIILDAFTQDIKRTVPSSIESVIIETDGTWRSEDNKHGTAKKVFEAKARASESIPPASANDSITNGGQATSRAASISDGLGESSKAGTPLDTKPDIGGLVNGNGNAANGKGKGPAEVIDLDDDDDDDTPPPPARTNGTSGNGNRLVTTIASTPRPAAKSGGGVIDLTLSDDDDDPEEEITYRRPVSAVKNNSAAQKRRVDSDWEDGPEGGSSHQRSRYN